MCLKCYSFASIRIGQTTITVNVFQTLIFYVFRAPLTDLLRFRRSLGKTHRLTLLVARTGSTDLIVTTIAITNSQFWVRISHHLHLLPLNFWDSSLGTRSFWSWPTELDTTSSSVTDNASTGEKFVWIWSTSVMVQFTDHLKCCCSCSKE